MRHETIALTSDTPGLNPSLTVYRFGTPNTGRKVYIQGALHADEVPAILVAHALRTLLIDAEKNAQINGEIVLVPFANPLGLAQEVLGQHVGRFDLHDGVNFNRNYVDLVEQISPRLRDVLGPNAAQNTAHIRAALRQAMDDLPDNTAVLALKKELRRLAVDADIVLDLHCDSEALMHLYALTPQAPMAEMLGADLGAVAILLATESGDFPFDESCSAPWLQLQTHFPQHPIELACFSVTVELRGQTDTTHAFAAHDAAALSRFLMRQGVLQGSPSALPSAHCQATPLAGSEPLIAPHSGVVVFRRELGECIKAGETVADLVCAISGNMTPINAPTTGIFYARRSARWVRAGNRLGKIAGTSAGRTGKLLSP